ncbi:YlzJ-like family protein [Pseudalkalibacillus salsuginis]|uniref:YlzJ-like family protein n=1 Tax=Pseudalkalibacillus salsuginis TaxID=2910972 RepID=UPI001F163B8C|nr:YlzJ-like family protein [Pseudalkalibacillus salsuginis]MCF6410626.1 YlzJ-like family protein [Pseudalkalibacillus salsuginis]
MILYTSMPNELVFNNAAENYDKHSMIEMNGVSMMVEHLDENQCRIVNLLSTDPYHYLNPSLQPGTVLKKSFHYDESPSSS